jgi:hypothetical protein
MLAEGSRWKWQDGRSGRIYRTLLAVGRLVLQGRLTRRSLNVDTASSTDLLPLVDAHLTGAWKGMKAEKFMHRAILTRASRLIVT